MMNNGSDDSQRLGKIMRWTFSSSLTYLLWACFEQLNTFLLYRRVSMRSSVVYVRNTFRTRCCRRFSFFIAQLRENRHLFRHHNFLLQLKSTDELRDAQNHNLISFFLLCNSRCSLIMTLMTMLTSLAPKWQVNRQRTVVDLLSVRKRASACDETIF